MIRLIMVGWALLIASTAFAQTSGDITIQSIWARATPPGATTGAVYVTLVNKGHAGDKLVGAETSIADMAGLHSEYMENGVMKMREIKSIDIKPGKRISLVPGGRHIMLMGLRQPLKPGDHFAMTLRFEHAAPLTVQVQVTKIGATKPDMDMGGMKDMQ